MQKRAIAVLLLVVMAPMAGLGIPVASAERPPADDPAQPSPAEVEGASTTETVAGTIAATPASALRPATAPQSASDAAAANVAAQRERMADGVRPGPSTGPAPSAPAVLPPETAIGALSEVASVTKNYRNTTAQSVSNTLAEPAAANDGRDVIYSGNTYVSRSTNSGASWVQEAIPAGPADATIACCDPEVVYSPTTDTTFNIMLYTNAAQTNGVVRIFVRNGLNSSVDCTYDIDPAGTADNVLPDYPHLALSNNFLYLSLNNLSNGSWTGAEMRRFNLSQMSSCQSTSFNTFNHVGSAGQRIQVPAEGATTVMYWGSLDNTTTFRAFSWPESSTSVSEVTRTITASAFANPDCRGGTGDFDFVERATAWSIAGFRLRGATGGGRVTFLWPSSPVGGATQAHLRGVSLNTSDLSIFAQPVVFNNSICFSYPALGSNAFADLGLSLAAGGQAGGGGSAAQGYIAVDDSESAGIFFPSLTLTASGTHNRSDGRFGDYFTVRRNSRCANTWVATNYALDGGNTSSSHVNARYIEFQTTDDTTCPK